MSETDQQLPLADVSHHRDCTAPNLMTIPLEIRQEILHYILQSELIRIRITSRYNKGLWGLGRNTVSNSVVFLNGVVARVHKSKDAKALSLVCQRLNFEVLCILCKKNAILIEPPKRLLLLLGRYDIMASPTREPLGGIRHLALDYGTVKPEADIVESEKFTYAGTPRYLFDSVTLKNIVTFRALYFIPALVTKLVNLRFIEARFMIGPFKHTLSDFLAENHRLLLLLEEMNSFSTWYKRYKRRKTPPVEGSDLDRMISNWSFEVTTARHRHREDKSWHISWTLGTTALPPAL